MVPARTTKSLRRAGGQRFSRLRRINSKRACPPLAEVASSILASGSQIKSVDVIN